MSGIHGFSSRVPRVSRVASTPSRKAYAREQRKRRCNGSKSGGAWKNVRLEMERVMICHDDIWWQAVLTWKRKTQDNDLYQIFHKMRLLSTYFKIPKLARRKKTTVSCRFSLDELIFSGGGSTTNQSPIKGTPTEMGTRGVNWPPKNSTKMFGYWEQPCPCLGFKYH